MNIWTFCLAVSISGIATQDPAPDIPSAVGSYEFKNGKKVSGLGVCRVTEEMVDCWDMNGEHDASLTERVKAQFMAGYERDVQTRFGKKNRYVVLRADPNLNFQASTPNGQYLGSINFPGPSEEGQTMLFRVLGDPGSSTADLRVRVFGLDPAKVEDLPFRKGAVGKMGQNTVEVGEWKSVKRPEWFNFGYPGSFAKNSSYWTVILGYQPLNTGFEYSGLTLLDKEGKIIQYVDSKGKPVSAANYLATLPRVNNQRFPVVDNPKFSTAVFQPNNSANVPGAMEFLTNVDPTVIGSLRRVSSSETSVLLTGFPLDPKGTAQMETMLSEPAER
jgi:hypothetical protein